MVCPVALNYFIPDERLHFLFTLVSFLLLYLLLGWVSLNSTMLISLPSLALAAKLLSGAICYVNKVMELYWSQQQSLRNAARNQPKAGIINHTPLQLMAQPIFHPPHWPLIQSQWSQVDNKPCEHIHHSPFTHRVIYLLTIHSQAGQAYFTFRTPVLSVLSVLSQLVQVLMSFMFPVMAPRWLIKATNLDPSSLSCWRCAWLWFWFYFLPLCYNKNFIVYLHNIKYI